MSHIFFNNDVHSLEYCVCFMYRTVMVLLVRCTSTSESTRHRLNMSISEDVVFCVSVCECERQA